MTTYRWDSSIRKFVDKQTGVLMAIKDDNAICRPMVISDTPEYISPVTGKPVDGRRARRDDLARSGCVPFEPLSNRPRGISNPKFAAKHGLKLDEAAQHRVRTKRIDALADVRKT